ncbi:MAG: TonB-dependent receptor [Flavobacterium sp.]|uniref:TonB-dependent receptor domain-containing protein n=1 Tax=Flavobacterium sp. TaxID=239 RepID=UPI000C63922A|nr:TonB-dependent receptor [Flavobacterium sp.]MBF01676.1 TonB-dependent receptor [Flavobacterium sp.]|tara:strand:- start:1931 stop:4339 length:2409 start_codon:yes stop_codon:yes gene_type:complete
MKTTALSLFLFLCVVSITRAQSFSVQGIVLGKNDLPLVKETVYLLGKINHEIVKISVTDDKGGFILSVSEANSYLLTIANADYELFQDTISITETKQVLSPIRLIEKIQVLDEVVVIKEKPMIQVLADKTIFNVSASISTTGTNALQLLRKAPGVSIDNSGSIILEGKTGAQIFIDGKPTLLNGQELQAYLETLQSSDIDKVEIITHPSSKYDAAGNAGILNIVFKKDKNRGVNGSLSNAFTMGDYARNNASFAMNYRNKKNNLFGNVSQGIGKSTGFLYLKRQQNNTEFDAKTESIYTPKTTNLRLGYDCFATEKSTFGILLNSNWNHNTNQSNSRTPIQAYTSATIDSVLIANTISKSNSQNLLLNVNYKYSDTLDTYFNVDIDYGKFNREGYAFQPNYYYDTTETTIISQALTTQETPIDIDIVSLQTDYEQRLGKGKIATGIKMASVTTENTFNFYNQMDNDYVLNLNRSNQFQYRETIYATYGNYNIQKEKWSFQLGIRMENTISRGNLIQDQSNANKTVKRNYTNWFPSGGITYQMNPKNQLALNYSKRIQRPNYSSLNPFEYKIDELSSSRGNPFLQPQYTHTIKLTNTYNYKLSTALSYTYVSDFFAQITEAEGTNRNYLSPQNIANQEVFNLGIALPYQFTNWWSVYVSINAYTSKYLSNNPNFIPLKQETVSFYGQQTFSLPKELTLELSGWFSSPSVWGGTYVTKNIGALNLAFQKKFFHKSLQASIAFNDILYTIPWRGNTQYGGIQIQGTGGSDSRNLVFSLNYTFGNSEIKKSRNRNTSLEDEKGRVN